MPDPFEALQSDIAKARLAVDKSQAKLARLHEDRQLRSELAQRGRAFAVRALGQRAALSRLEREILGE